MSIVQYHTEDTQGNETQFAHDYVGAKAHAEEHSLRVIETTYEFADSEMVLDCIPKPECSYCGADVEKGHEIEDDLLCDDCFEVEGNLS